MINQLVLFFRPFSVMKQNKPIHDLTEAEIHALIASIELEEPKRLFAEELREKCASEG
jgi:hypothetical protein